VPPQPRCPLNPGAPSTRERAGWDEAGQRGLDLVALRITIVATAESLIGAGTVPRAA